MLHLLTDLKHSVRSVCFSADGDLLVSGSDDKTLKVWSKGSSGTFECQSTLRGHSSDNPECTCQHFDEDGDEDYEADPQCPVTGHNGYVPAFPCSACSQSRGACSLFSDTQGGQLRRI